MKIRKGLIVVIRFITFGYIDFDPNYTIDAEDLREQITVRGEELKKVREEKKTVLDEIAKLTEQVRSAAREGKVAGQEVVFSIMLLRREQAAHNRNEAMICRNIAVGRENLAMIELLGYSKPIRVRPEVSKISDRLQVQVDGVLVDGETAVARTSDVTAAVSIDALNAELDGIRREILGEDQTAVPDHNTRQVVETAPSLRPPLEDVTRARATAETADAYEVVEEGEEDESGETPRLRKLEGGEREAATG